MNQLFTILFIFTAITVSAMSGDKEFLDSDFNPLTEKSDAMYYRLVSKGTDSLYISHVYYLNEVLQMRGHYSDESLSSLHGKCVFYFINGQKESEGYYAQNLKIGVWKRYNLFGEHKADKYYPTKEELAQDKFISSLASYKGGQQSLDIYLEKSTVFPKEALSEGHSKGKVNINIKLSEDGLVVGFEVLASNSEYFSKEAIRLVTSMPQWSPALKDGMAVKSSYIISIPFVNQKTVAQ